MTQTSATTASPSGFKAFFVRNYDLTPVFFVYLMIAGFFLYYNQPEISWRFLLGKKILVPLSNLGLFYYILFVKGLPSFLTLLAERHKDIKEGILSFTERDDEISRRWRETKEKLTHVDEETKDIVKRAHLLAAEEQQSLQQKADTKAERIVSETEVQILQASRSLKQEMQKHLLDRSFQKAEETLASQLLEAEQLAWQDDFLDEIRT